MDKLADHRRNYHSQNGEDGIIEMIFKTLGVTSGFCVEFGAWDGLHLSNTRHLLLNGWEGLLIECDPERYKLLTANYSGNQKVKCVNALVDSGANSLSAIMKRLKIDRPINFLSVDIDGFDYYVLEQLDVRPDVICIEVNAGHAPENTQLLPREVAGRNVGQPLACFVQLAEKLGYALVCYTANAFFIKQSLCSGQRFTALSPQTAYAEFIRQCTTEERLWLYLVNKGWVPPYFGYDNSHLSRAALQLSSIAVGRALLTAGNLRLRAALKNCIPGQSSKNG